MAVKHFCFLLVLTGCDRTIPVHLTTHEGTAILQPSDETQELLDGAFGFWGVGIELVDDSRWFGALRLEIVELDLPEDEDIVLGKASRRGCLAHVVSHHDINVLRHELGHVWLGPEHVADSDNLMAERTGGEELTQEQEREADKGINRFLACR